MKKIYIVINKENEIVCVIGSEKYAKQYCKEYGHTFETYTVI